MPTFPGSGTAFSFGPLRWARLLKDCVLLLCVGHQLLREWRTCVLSAHVLCALLLVVIITRRNIHSRRGILISTPGDTFLGVWYWTARQSPGGGVILNAHPAMNGAKR